jgi:hypothetical protein
MWYNQFVVEKCRRTRWLYTFLTNRYTKTDMVALQVGLLAKILDNFALGKVLAVTDPFESATINPSIFL